MNVSDDSEDEAIAQQAALAQARFGNQTKKPVANQDVSNSLALDGKFLFTTLAGVLTSFLVA